MDIRTRIMGVGRPLPELDNDIVRAFDADAWPDIDDRIANHVDFSFLCLDRHFTSDEQQDLWRSVTSAMYTAATRKICEECIEEFTKLISMRDRMEADKLCITPMNRVIKECFEVLDFSISSW